MVDRDRLRAELRKMKELIQSDPQVKAKFDIDGNGVIDGHEWEQVRQLVIQRLERGAAEAAEAERLAQKAQQASRREELDLGSGLELAYDPREGEVAEEIYETDFPAAYGGAVAASEIGGADDLVLEQQGGLAQLAEGTLRRNYEIKAPDGSTLGSVSQVESQLLQGLTRKSIFDLPDLNFHVSTRAGEMITFRRSQDFAAARIEVLEAGATPVAQVKWVFSLVKRKYHVTALMERGALAVQGKIFKPFTMEIRNDIGETIGTVVRGWSGLGGFLTGGNRMRIHVRPGSVTPNQRWGLIAAALLEDLGSEARGR